ncbi:MAG: hypothetical protein IT184_16640 [Acidobacteria bacterium]|nr:hypothetical protein [Acidobacteriota bacterium]
MTLVRSETELTTAATDALLAAVCAVEAWRLAGLPAASPWKQHAWLAVLSSMAVAALLGAAVHGVEWSPRARLLLWKPIYLSLGLTAALVVVCAIADGWGDAVAARSLPWAVAAAAGFFAVSQAARGSFAMFVAYEAVALIAAIAIYVTLATAGTPGATAIAAGLLLSMIAAAIQTSRLRARLVFRFDHNGLFHLVQIASVAVIAAGVRATLG